MNSTRLLDACRAAGLSLQLDGPDLFIEAERDPPSDLIAELRQHKAEVIALLRAEPPDDIEERASIVEYDGNIPRLWAEGFARLDPDRPPGDLPPRRWQRFVDDVGLFLNGDFVEQAASLGWGPSDLFRCDRDRPFARIDQAGLLWLLNGDRLVALTAHTALIETATGARQTCRRKPAEPGRVLAWELA
jgi:hypothetical protein